MTSVKMRRFLTPRKTKGVPLSFPTLAPSFSFLSFFNNLFIWGHAGSLWLQWAFL